MDRAASFFVYGTLKRNQCRARLWPLPPRNVHIAFVRGTLYDLGPYPALTEGEDWVQGELWHFDHAARETVRATLDQIEVFQQPGEADLYVRTQIDVFECPTRPAAYQAETYYYALPYALVEQGVRCSPTHSDAAIPYVSWPSSPASS